MKKNKLINLLKPRTLLLGICLLILSCQQEDNILSNLNVNSLNSDNSNLIIESSTLNWNEFTKKTFLNNKSSFFKGFNNKNTTDSNKVTNSENDSAPENLFVDQIKMYQHKDTITYTFAIIEDNLEEDKNVFRNLVLKTTNNIDFEAYIIKYLPSQEWLNSDTETTQYQGQAEMYNYTGTYQVVTNSSSNADCHFTINSYWICEANNVGHYPGHRSCRQTSGFEYVTVITEICSNGVTGGTPGTWDPNTGKTIPTNGSDNDSTESNGGNSNTDNDQTDNNNNLSIDGLITKPNIIIDINKLKNELFLNNSQLDWLSKNLDIAEDISNFLKGNNNSNEAKEFARQAIALEITLNNELQIAQTNLSPQELNSCCPSYGDYDNDKIIKEYGVQPVQSAVDGTFNLIVSSISLVKSDEWVGKRVRRIMTEIGMTVPIDVTNEHLAAIFKIRKRNGLVIVEYREGILGTMLDFGLNTLDMISFLTPSKGGGAFLASKIGGISITKITAHLRKIAVNNKKVDDIVSKLNKSAKFELNGTGPNNVVKGHHPLSKSAFKSDKFYDLKKAFSVSANSLGGQAVHNAITGNQNRLYSAFAKKGEVLTLDKMADIEIQAMFDAGIPRDIATGWAIKALQDLKAQGVKIITHIPWNGIN